MQEYSDDELLATIEAWVSEYGVVPTTADWHRTRHGGMPCLATFKYRFGSWSEAVRRAGYTPRPRGAAGHITTDRSGTVFDRLRGIA